MGGDASCSVALYASGCGRLGQSKFEHLQGIVVLDCAPAHIGEQVFQVAKDRDLYLCYVPDVGFFSPLSAFLCREARAVKPQRLPRSIGFWPWTGWCESSYLVVCGSMSLPAAGLLLVVGRSYGASLGGLWQSLMSCSRCHGRPRPTS